MQSTMQYIERGKYGRFGRYLHERHFAMMVGLALLLHLGGVGISALMPREAVQEIAVRTLNVKLGGMPTVTPAGQAEADTGALEAAVQIPSHAIMDPSADAPFDTVASHDAVAALEKQISEPAKPEEPKPIAKDDPLRAVKESARAKAAANRQAAASKPVTGPRQYVREGTGGGGGSGEGSAYGNSTKADAVVKARYTQVVSLWLDKHKIYPAEAQQLGQEGRVVLRIRIDRRGNIVRWGLEQPSGYPQIDQAMTSVINAANPLPPVPANYPDSSDILEYLVPINFRLHQDR